MHSIATWNCNMAFRKKSHLIIHCRYDFLIVQECETLDKINLVKKAKSSLWIGDNQNKGLAVFSFSDFTLKLNPLYNNAYRYVIPIDVYLEEEKQFTFFAVWAMYNPINREQRYIGQIVYAMREYQSLLDEKTIIIGDFNWNKIWDARKKKSNLADLLAIIDARNIKSLYHLHFDEDFGCEKQSTLFLQKSLLKPYHIDYCFAGSYWHKKLKDVRIGKPDEWLSNSDHMPLSCYFF